MASQLACNLLVSAAKVWVREPLKVSIHVYREAECEWAWSKLGGRGDFISGSRLRLGAGLGTKLCVDV